MSDTVASRRAHGDAEKRERIVEAAVRAIEAHGCDAGLGAVAEQAGLPRPHVYRHFAGKEALEAAVAEHAARLLSAWIRPQLTAVGTPPEVIRGVIGGVLRWAVDHPNLYRFRIRLGPTRAVPELHDAGIANLQAAGYDAHLPAHAVAGVVGLVDATVIWWLDHPDEIGLDQLVDSLAARVWLVLADALARLGRPLDPHAPIITRD